MRRDQSNRFFLLLTLPVNRFSASVQKKSVYLLTKFLCEDTVTLILGRNTWPVLRPASHCSD
jgi:hypothetical protein